MTFAVTINDSPRYVVHSKSILGAVKNALAASDGLSEEIDADFTVRIVVTPVPAKKI